MIETDDTERSKEDEPEIELIKKKKKEEKKVI